MRLVGAGLETRLTRPKARVANARRAWGERRALLLRVRGDAGVGVGEACPLPGYSPECFDDARRGLERWIELEAGSGSASLKDLDDVRRSVAAVPVEAPSARFAVETALLDLLAAKKGQPLHRLLAAESGQEVRGVPVAALVASGAEDPAEPARALIDAGFRHLKIKIGHAGRWCAELAGLRTLRRELGLGWHLRLDANGSLPSEGLRDRLDELATLEPELLEEPVAWPALGGVEQSPVPLAIDEGLRRPWAELAPWLARSAAAVVLKPMVLGGALPCLEIAKRARALGLDAVASHLFDGPVALQATAAMALALPNRPGVAHGLARHTGLEGWPAMDDGGWLVQGPRLEPTRGRPGLGVGS